MPRFLKKQSHKIGLAPGALVFSGPERTEEINMHVINYDGEIYEERDLSTVAEAAEYREEPTVSWIDMNGVHDMDLIRDLGERYKIHPLVLEDIVNTGQRPKTEELDDYLFIVVKMLYYDPVQHILHAEQVSFVLGDRYVLSFQERQGDVFEPVRARLRSSNGRIRVRGADYLAYALLDIIIDNYFVVLEAMSTQIEELEAKLLENAFSGIQQEIGEIRRELILLRKAIWPVRDLISGLDRSESPLISDETKPFLRDAYDHTVQVIDIVESLRDMIGVLRDSYQSILGNRMNEIMKVLTIIGTIFIPLTFLAGIYGMNFDNMPELHARYGYPVLLVIMLIVAAFLVGFFRRKDWL